MGKYEGVRIEFVVDTKPEPAKVLAVDGAVRRANLPKLDENIRQALAKAGLTVRLRRREGDLFEYAMPVADWNSVVPRLVEGLVKDQLAPPV